jgi:hypothetical protein
VYGLTICKRYCGRLTLKIDTKANGVLRIEAGAPNARTVAKRRALPECPRMVTDLKAVLERFVDALAVHRSQLHRRRDS